MLNLPCLVFYLIIYIEMFEVQYIAWWTHKDICCSLFLTLEFFYLKSLVKRTSLKSKFSITNIPYKTTSGNKTSAKKSTATPTLCTWYIFRRV